jgi:parallel beta-helix repeat protein
MLGRTGKILLGVATAALAAAALAVPTGGAYGAVITVNPGQSIQAAVNAASPGDTIQVAAGVFHQSVEITKSVTISGAGQGSTVLLPPTTPPTQSAICQDPNNKSDLNGFCIHGTFDSQMNLTTPVGPVTITGFTVKSFPELGVLFLGATSPTVDHVSLLKNGAYGTAAFVSTSDHFTNNIANHNGEAGIYVGDSPGANAVIDNNQSLNNNIGIFIRDASGASSASPGQVTNNFLRGNCVGIVFLNTGAGESHWAAGNNQASANNAFCPPGDGPSVSGTGIAVIGPTDVNVHDNLVTNNQPSQAATISGGIVVGNSATSIVVQKNAAHRNLPDDMVWDQSGSATFTNNSCRTSSPADLC